MFTHDDVRINLTAEGVPQLYFDQLSYIRHHLDDIRSPTSPTARKLTRRTLADTADWPEWEASEYKLLNQFAQQGMFADPIPTPPNGLRLQLGVDLQRQDRQSQTKKARGVCDGPTRGGQVPTLNHAYAFCVEQTSLRLFFALSALENKRICGADVSNAFAGAHPPAQTFHMRVDHAF
jgi:hypothetical protein